MGKKRLQAMKEKYGDWNERHKESKELKLQQKEGLAVYRLTLKLMKEDNLTYEQVQECYK